MNCMTMKYQALEQVSYDEALLLLKSGDADQCLMLPLRAGEYIGDWKQAEDICLRCCESRDPALRANAVLGLSYVARRFRKLDRPLVKPHIFKELRENHDFRSRIMDAVSDINLFLGWHLAEKTLSRLRSEFQK